MNTGNFPANDIWLDESIITNQSSRRLQPYSEVFHYSIFKRTCHFVSLLQDGAENVVKSLQGTVCPCSTMTTIFSLGLYTNSAPSAHDGCCYESLLFTTDCPPKLSPPSALYKLYLVIIASLLLGHRWSNTHSYWCSFKSFYTSQKILFPSYNIVTFISFITYGSFYIHHPNVISAFHLSSNCSLGTPAPSTYYSNAHMLLKDLCSLLCPR